MVEPVSLIRTATNPASSPDGLAGIPHTKRHRIVHSRCPRIEQIGIEEHGLVQQVHIEIEPRRITEQIVADVEDVVLVSNPRGNQRAFRRGHDEVVPAVYVSHLGPEVDLGVQGVRHEDRVVVDERLRARAPHGAASTVIADPEDLALLVPRFPIRVLPVSVVDTDVVAVSTADVVPEDLDESPLIVVAEIVLEHHVLVSIIDVGPIGISRPMGVEETVLLNHHILAIEGPETAAPLPHPIVLTRPCVVERAALDQHVSALVGHKPGSPCVEEATAPHRDALVLVGVDPDQAQRLDPNGIMAGPLEFTPLHQHIGNQAHLAIQFCAIAEQLPIIHGQGIESNVPAGHLHPNGPLMADLRHFNQVVPEFEGNGGAIVPGPISQRPDNPPIRTRQGKGRHMKTNRLRGSTVDRVRGGHRDHARPRGIRPWVEQTACARAGRIGGVGPGLELDAIPLVDEIVIDRRGEDVMDEQAVHPEVVERSPVRHHLHAEAHVAA